LSTLYTSTAETNVTGTISGSCTKEATDVSRPFIFIGVDRGATGARKATRQNGAQTLTYNIYQGSVGGGQWTQAAGQTYGSGISGGVLYRMANLAVGTPQSFSFSYYLRINSGQILAPAGIYDDSLVSVFVQLSNNGGSNTGIVLSQTTFSVTASIQNECYFSTTPASLTMDYASFSTVPVTASVGFQLSCTYNSAYTMALTPTSGTLAGLNYSVALSAASGTGTAASQSYTVNGTIAAGQAGTCAIGTCTGTQVHTVTVTY